MDGYFITVIVITPFLFKKNLNMVPIYVLLLNEYSPFSFQWVFSLGSILLYIDVIKKYKCVACYVISELTKDLNIY